MNLEQDPWWAALLWCVLHAADYYLTLWGAVRYRKAAAVVSMGNYELNPLWQGDVAKLRWASPKFLLSLVLIGGMMWGYTVLAFSFGVGWLAEMLLGVVLFTRAALIARHLANIAYFGHLRAHPQAVRGQTEYSRGTVYFLSTTSHAQIALVVITAAIVVRDPWTVGGAIGMVLTTLVAYVRSLRAPKRVATPAKSDANDQ